jgi:hypothetical protein
MATDAAGASDVVYFIECRRAGPVNLGIGASNKLQACRYVDFAESRSTTGYGVEGKPVTTDRKPDPYKETPN